MCLHGEPKGPHYCALCRRQIADKAQDLMDKALTAKELWTVQAELAIKQLAHHRAEFSADDLIELVGLPAGTEIVNGNNAVGALFRKFSRQGFIKHRGWVASSRPDNHGRQIRTWVRAY